MSTSSGVAITAETEKLVQEVKDALSAMSSTIPSFYVERLEEAIKPSRLASSLAANEEQERKWCEDIKVENIIHVVHSDAGVGSDGPWLVLHYKVQSRTEDKTMISATLKRVYPERSDPSFLYSPGEITEWTWNKSTPTSFLSADPKDWKCVSGMAVATPESGKTSSTKLWPFLQVSRVCDPSTCEHKGKDGVSEFYFGP